MPYSNGNDGLRNGGWKSLPAVRQGKNTSLGSTEMFDVGNGHLGPEEVEPEEVESEGKSDSTIDLDDQVSYV